TAPVVPGLVTTETPSIAESPRCTVADDFPFSICCAMSSAWLIGIAYPSVVVPDPLPFPEPFPEPSPYPSPLPNGKPVPSPLPVPSPSPLPQPASVAVAACAVEVAVCPGRPWPPLLLPPATSTPTTWPLAFTSGPPE